MIGIYKITNKINQKCYIGQSINIIKRWSNHKTLYKSPQHHSYNMELYVDMRKYGIENFIFDVVEECLDYELDNKEIYWIKYYDSCNCGYNKTIGGKHSVISKINENLLDEITFDLINTNIKINEISQKYNLSYELIQGINTGRYYKRDINYPIRKRVKKINYCIDCGKIIDKKSKRCVDCHYKATRVIQRPDFITLFHLICLYSFVQIGNNYGVSDNTVRKWCKSYGLPYKQKDIQLLKYGCLV